VTSEDALRALNKATTEKAEEGAVGAGAGMICCGFKGGIGTSSRVVRAEDASYTVGCLVLSNFGRKEDLFHYHPLMKDDVEEENRNKEMETDGSNMMVLATDVPVNERQLNRIAKRCGIGLGRTGSHMAH